MASEFITTSLWLDEMFSSARQNTQRFEVIKSGLALGIDYDEVENEEINFLDVVLKTISLVTVFNSKID